MRRRLKQAATGLLTALMLISAMAMAVPVSAATKSSNDFYKSIGDEDGYWWATKEKNGIVYNTQKVILTYYPNDKNYTDLYLDSYIWGMGPIRLLNVQKNQYNVADYGDNYSGLKTSDPSVATVKVVNDQIIVKPKKAGTTTITYKWKYETDDGVHVEKYSMKVTVKNYKNPFKSLKIAGKKVSAKKLKKHSVCTLSYKSLKNKKTKVSYKLASGWKVTDDTCYKPKATDKTYKKISGKGFTFKFELENTKTGQREDVEIVLK